MDDEILDLSLKFIDKAKSDGEPFFLWLNPTRTHIVTHLSETTSSIASSNSPSAGSAARSMSTRRFLTNLRLDPCERTAYRDGNNG